MHYFINDVCTFLSNCVTFVNESYYLILSYLSWMANLQTYFTVPKIKLNTRVVLMNIVLENHAVNMSLTLFLVPFLHTVYLLKVALSFSINQSESHSDHQQPRFTRNYMGSWRTWRRPPTSSLLLDWSCKRTRKRRRQMGFSPSTPISSHTKTWHTNPYISVNNIDLYLVL